jgi:Zn-finger protein
MTISMDSLAKEVAALRGFTGRIESELTPAEFDDFRNGMGRIKRAYDAAASAMAHELARRSSPELGAGGLARQEGFSNAQQSLGKTLGITPSQAGKLIDAGRALAPPAPSPGVAATPSAASPRARYPYVSGALKSTDMGAEVASLITRTLDAIGASYAKDGVPLTDARLAELAELERALVTKAQSLSLAELRRVCERERAWRFPQELAAKERLHRENRTLFFHEDSEGMIILTARMDVTSAAPIKAYIDAQTRWALQQRRSTRDGGSDIDDSRSAGQMRLDALTALAQHGLGCTSTDSGVKTTVVIRINERDLKDELALGECDQASGPVTVGTLRTMAVDAGLLPVVLGGQSLPLDVGRMRRLFTPAQRLALVERDGGCSWCHAPPSFCEAHHIRWWERDGGGTDLKNGVLLCTRCHHRVHRDGWTVRIERDTVLITKPGEAEPRLGGREHLELDSSVRDRALAA